MKTGVIAFLVTILCTHGTATAQDHGQRPTRYVTVRGEGVISVPPDQLRLSVQVNARAETATSALKEASGKTAAIFKVPRYGQ